jgi:hypothetical protein
MGVAVYDVGALRSDGWSLGGWSGVWVIAF